MILRFVKLIIALVVIAALLHLVSVNQSPVTLTLYGDWKLSNYSLGSTAIIVFLAGVLVASIFGLILAAPRYVRERKFRFELKRANSFYDRLSVARQALASKQWARAKALWEALTRVDPTDVIASIELSKALENLGDAKGALKELNRSRAKKPDNIELLIRTAELYESQGNRSGALDSLAHILTIENNDFAAKKAVELALELHKLEDAKEYLRVVDSSSSDYGELNQKVSLAQLVDGMDKISIEEQKSHLRKFCRKNPKSISAIKLLNNLNLTSPELDEAAKLTLEGFIQTQSLDLLRELERLSMKDGLKNVPSVLNILDKATSDPKRLANNAEALVLKSKLMLVLGRIEAANLALEQALTFDKLTPQLNSKIKILKSLLALELGDSKVAKDILKSELESQVETPVKEAEVVRSFSHVINEDLADFESGLKTSGTKL